MNSCELFANGCSRVLCEQHCCSRIPFVRELIREQVANKLSLLFVGIFTKLAYFGGYSKKHPECQRMFREKIVKSLLNSYNILGKQFANYANSWRTVSLKTKWTIMNTGYANRSWTLFEQLFTNRISETQTPALIGSWFWSGPACRRNHAIFTDLSRGGRKVIDSGSYPEPYPPNGLSSGIEPKTHPPLPRKLCHAEDQRPLPP